MCIREYEGDYKIKNNTLNLFDRWVPPPSKRLFIFLYLPSHFLPRKIKLLIALHEFARILVLKYVNKRMVGNRVSFQAIFLPSIFKLLDTLTNYYSTY